MNRPSSDSESPAEIATGAYLVLQTAGRWSDVFRLAAPNQAVIGRASSNQIVIRSDRASRRHAKIEFVTAADSKSTGHWTIEDLGSRNGTFINGRAVNGQHRLDDGDVIQIAGYAITFAYRIDGLAGGVNTAQETGAAREQQATEDQLTMELDPASITDRRRHSQHLHPAGDDSTSIGPNRKLLQLAFAVARADDLLSAVDAVLDALTERVEFDTAGVYVWESSRPPTELAGIPLVATRQGGSRSYRRPPAQLMESVGGDEGQAILARNVTGDDGLATENSRGEFDVDSVIVAPIRNHDDRLLGLIHVTTTGGNAPLDPGDLEWIVAACEILAESLANLLDRRRLSRSLKQSRRKIRQLQDRLGDQVQIVGSSEAIRTVIGQIGQVAPTNAAVLIRGESGVGKELVAAAIHHASARRDGPLVCLNCAALSPSLLESELFGHEKGAFTGATDRKQGKFELADGGTLMLDEIGEMVSELQAKFLRVLEGHPFERVGGQQPIRTNVRVVAATNRDLQAMVRDGDFRQDLYYRLHVVEIVVPPLRRRGKDCLLLAEHFLGQFNLEMGRQINGFTKAAQQRLMQYEWPGNIRELKNVIERAVVLGTKPEIDADDLLLTPAAMGGARAPDAAPVECSLAELERAHIDRVLKHTDGNKSRAATILGIERSTLDRKLKKYAQQA